jgi:iron uptake system component EfeO
MRRSRPLLFGGGTVLAVTGMLLGGCAKSGDDKPVAGAKVVNITLTNSGCKPDAATDTAGPFTFKVKNSDATAPTEVELLQGDVIMGEKENLTPGLSGSFSLNLASGSYTLYCPNAKTEKWDFKVTGTAGASKLSGQVTTDLKTATDGYQQYVITEVDKLVPATKAFDDAVRAGDMDKAKSLFAPARYYYEEVEPVAESFGNIDPDVDARIDDVDDPSQWTGFHRIEKALWQDKSLKGMSPIADKLDADVARLKGLVATTTYQPAQLANGATELLNEVASSKITGEEDRYSHTDLSDFKANVAGAQKAYELLAPALKVIDPTLASTVEARFSDVTASLQPYQGDYEKSGFVSYSAVTPDQRKTLTQKVDALAEPLSEVAAKVTG